MFCEVNVTGLGIVCPAGLTAETSWRALLQGTRCIAADSILSTQLHAPVVSGRVSEFAARAGFESRDRVCQMAVSAALEAIGGDVDAFRASFGPLRLGISVGTSKGGIQHFTRLWSLLNSSDGIAYGVRSASEGFVKRSSQPKCGSGRQNASNNAHSPTFNLATDIPPDSAARAIHEMLGIPACVHTTVAACTTGTLSVIRGVQMIQDDQADVVICGGADASLHPLWFAAFEQMGALASPDPELGPAYACRPFDRDRRGFAVGEGAGILVLESQEASRLRGRHVLARITGHAVCTDPTGLTQLDESGQILAHAIRNSCEHAGISPRDIVCVHAHGTGTASNDLIEARALTSAMGDGVTETPMVSVKGMIGHLLGAAGAVELALACMCRSESFGNATLTNTDPQLGHMCLPRESFVFEQGPILKTSMGFGGHVAAVIVCPE